VIVSTQDPAGRDAFALLDRERKRREKIVKALPVQDDLARFLALAGDSFVVRRGPHQRTVLAAYPDSGESGRDTLIALPGLCLVTGRFEDAKKILRAFAKAMPEPTPPDALLWLFVAAWKYLQSTGDDAFVRGTMLPALRKAARQLERSAPDAPDSRTVEIEALGFNALSILAELEARLGDPEEAKALGQKARQAQKRFQETFGTDSPRPEHLLALSLPFPLLPKAKAAGLLAAIEEKLPTPSTWLLGAYCTALVRVQGAAGRKKALAAIESLRPRLGEAGTEAMTVAEVLRAYVEDLQAPVRSRAKKS
jgi:glycogen debranching enzyme